MKKALAGISAASADVPATIYYAFKQSELSKEGITSAGWASFLQAVTDSGLAVDGTWPIRSELGNRMIASGTNALASSIALAMFLDGDTKALRAYHAGDRENELVASYFRRAGLGLAAITKSAG
jgi:adenine-specific DNA methylase